MENQSKQLLRSSDQREAFGVRRLITAFPSSSSQACKTIAALKPPQSRRSARKVRLVVETAHPHALRAPASLPASFRVRATTRRQGCQRSQFGLQVGEGLKRFLACSLITGFFALSSHAENQRGVVSSVHPMATEAGLNLLKSGGNAVDAAVAVGLTLGVVDTPNSGIGGGCFMLIRLANGKFVAIDGREMSPAAATRDMFVRNGKADTDLSQTGALASGVPGELATFDYAVRKYGKKKLSELILPAAEIAENGFTLSASYANRLKSEAGDMAKFETSRAVFFKDGKPLQEGDLLKQPDLAATYRAIAGQGSDWFYGGVVARASRPSEANQHLTGGTPVPLGFAQATEKWMKSNGGLMTAADFADYQIKLREPITTTYRGYKIVSFAPPSSGGVHLLQMLNILEKFDLKSLDEATRLHVIAEAMKLAFADRAYWLGDPDFARVPRGLVSKEYAASLAKRISVTRATKVPSHGTPPKWERDVFKKGEVAAASLSPQRGEGLRVKGGTVIDRDEQQELVAEPSMLAVREPTLCPLPPHAALSSGRGEGGQRPGEGVGYCSVDTCSDHYSTVLTPHPGPLPGEGRGSSNERPMDSTGGTGDFVALRVLGVRIAMSASSGNEVHADKAVRAPGQAEKHTTHWSVADAEGNWVAVTATVNTSFGSKVVIPGTGVVMNNQMDDFSIQPGVTNYFGLVGGEANAAAPGKRPLSSMTPTIVLKNGKPIIALGAAGGPKIITAVLMELVYMLDLGMSAPEAIAAPRIHHQWSPGELMVEQSLPQDLRTALQQRGHEVKELNSMAVSHIVARSPDGRSFVGAADPRAGGNLAGW